ncbi:MAG: iron complex transport system permease protein, partial [Flavobacterium sp.]
MEQITYKKHFILLSVFLMVLFVLNISLGSVAIPFKDILDTLIGNTAAKESWQTIILHFRLPKAITAILVGSGLSVAGLLMQTLFRNPLAGPFVLGISSGASLGVALLILGSSLFGSFFFANSISNWSLPVASSLGAFLVLSAVIIAANKVRNTMSILIIGLMFGSLTSAIISVLAYFSEAQQIQQFLFWSFGSLGNLSWNELLIFIVIYSIGMLATLAIIKPLNSLLLGENYAKSLGINVKKNRNIILLITSILTGVITAFAGPIAFIGLAVPHIARMI